LTANTTNSATSPWRSAHLTVAFVTVAGVVFCALQLISRGAAVGDKTWQTRRILLLLVVLGYLAAVAATHFHIAKMRTGPSANLCKRDLALPIGGLAVAIAGASVVFVGVHSNLLMLGLWPTTATLTTVGTLSAAALLFDWFCRRSTEATPETEVFPASWRFKQTLLSMVVVVAIVLLECAK
jgi:hypothetical protein